jgi:peptide/nickel transport system substrate-binding protein
VDRKIEDADSEAVVGMLRGVLSRRAAIGTMAGTAAAALVGCGSDDDDAGSEDAAGSSDDADTDAPATTAVDDTGDTDTGSDNSDAIVRFAGDQNTSDMDPRTSTGQLGVMSRFNIFTPLISVDSATGGFTPLFIEELPEEEDSQSFLLKIAPGQKWHDGSEVTVDDVKYTVDWLLDPDNGSLFGSVVLDIVDSIEIVDAATFRIKLNRVSGSVFDRFALITPVPQAFAERVGSDEFKIAPMGNGPFIFDSFVLDDHMTVNRWDDYTFGPKAPVAQCKVSKIQEGSSRINALQGGQLEADITVDPELFPVLEGNDNIAAAEWPIAGYNAVMLNAGSGPFADVRVRQALAHAVNREEIVSAVWNDLARPQVGPIPPTNFMASSPVAPEFDPERSAALLEDAGVPGLEFELMQGIWSTGLNMVSVLQQQFQNAGFKVRPTTADSAGQYNRVFDGDWDAFSMRGNTAIIGTYADIYCRWTSRDIFNNAPAEDLQPLLDALEAADTIPLAEEEERKAAYAAIEQMIVDDARIIYLVNHGGMTGTVNGLSGLEVGPHQAPLSFSTLSLSA